MKHFLIFLTGLICTACFCFGNEKSDMSILRAHYRELLCMDGDGENPLQRYHEIREHDNTITQEINEAISVGDRKINNYVITHLFWKTIPYSSYYPTIKPNKDLLQTLGSIENLRPFLIKHMQNPMPHYKVFDVAAILFSDDQALIDEIIQIGMRNELMRASVLNGLRSANIYNDSVEPLVLQAVLSKDYLTVSVAAYYLTLFPLPNMLPHLVRQYQRPACELRFSVEDIGIRGMYVDIDEAFFKNITNLDPLQQADSLRFVVGQALLSYEVNALSVYFDEIQAAPKKNQFGPMGQRIHDQILRKMGRGSIP